MMNVISKSKITGKSRLEAWDYSGNKVTDAEYDTQAEAQEAAYRIERLFAFGEKPFEPIEIEYATMTDDELLEALRAD